MRFNERERERGMIFGTDPPKAKEHFNHYSMDCSTDYNHGVCTQKSWVGLDCKEGGGEFESQKKQDPSPMFAFFFFLGTKKEEFGKKDVV